MRAFDGMQMKAQTVRHNLLRVRQTLLRPHNNCAVGVHRAYIEEILESARQ